MADADPTHSYAEDFQYLIWGKCGRCDPAGHRVETFHSLCLSAWLFPSTVSVKLTLVGVNPRSINFTTTIIGVRVVDEGRTLDGRPSAQLRFVAT
jgi:hypothetical protein